MAEKFTKLDPLDHLTTEEDMDIYLDWTTIPETAA